MSGMPRRPLERNLLKYWPTLIKEDMWKIETQESKKTQFHFHSFIDEL